MGDKKEIKEAINQLENLRCHCIEMSNNDGCEEWGKDVKALEMAIECLKKEIYSEKAEILTFSGSFIVPKINFNFDFDNGLKHEAFINAVKELEESNVVRYYEIDGGSNMEYRAEIEVVKRNHIVTI